MSLPNAPCLCNNELVDGETVRLVERGIAYFPTRNNPLKPC